MHIPRELAAWFLLVLAQTQADGKRSRTIRLSSRFSPRSSSLSQPSCTCDCCHVALRMPTEVHETTGAFLKCAVNEASGSQSAVTAEKGVNGAMIPQKTECSSYTDWRGGTCILPVTTKVLDPTSQEGVDYNHFCFYGCQPYTFAVGDPCVPLDRREAKSARSGDGGPLDPGLAPEEQSVGGTVNVDGVREMPRLEPGLVVGALKPGASLPLGRGTAGMQPLRGAPGTLPVQEVGSPAPAPTAAGAGAQGAIYSKPWQTGYGPEGGKPGTAHWADKGEEDGKGGESAAEAAGNGAHQMRDTTAAGMAAAAAGMTTGTAGAMAAGASATAAAAARAVPGAAAAASGAKASAAGGAGSSGKGSSTKAMTKGKFKLPTFPLHYLKKARARGIARNSVQKHLRRQSAR
mmetsp:Transcript_79990/g.212307  ORF Transcript_79990/g.212307 Transcript_79990/m.212307 type:complete len:404 (-) Transcript_79990:30-1241(-)